MMNGSATYFNCLERGIRAGQRQSRGVPLLHRLHGLLVQAATTLGAIQPGSIMLNGQLG